MVLLRAVDALDVYISSANSKPFLLQQARTRAEMDNAGQSVWAKFEVTQNCLRSPKTVVSALVALMINWRNRAAHSKAEDKLPEEFREIIRQNPEELERNFRGLCGDTLLAGYDEERQPSLKEVTSFINATHQYVRQMESDFLQTLDAELFLKQLIWNNLRLREESRLARDRTADRKRHLRSIWGKDPNGGQRSAQSFLKRCGLTFNPPANGSYAVTFEDDLLEELFSKTPTEVFKWMDEEQVKLS